jgi:hypothetical protein
MSHTEILAYFEGLLVNQLPSINWLGHNGLVARVASALRHARQPAGYCRRMTRRLARVPWTQHRPRQCPYTRSFRRLRRCLVGSGPQVETDIPM